MYGVTFEGIHSYRDWKLITKARPIISPALPKTKYIDIPEADGVLDLTESLTGNISYKTRTVTLEFTVIEARKNWFTIYSKIQNFLQGKRIKIVLDEDPAYYYEGRFQVNDWLSDKKTSTIVITGEVDPYKMEITSSVEDWLWDTFNFENGVIREYKDIVVDQYLSLDVIGSRKRTVPVITISDAMSMSFEGVSYFLNAGTHRLTSIVLKEGVNNFQFFHTVDNLATISIEFKGGSL